MIFETAGHRWRFLSLVQGQVRSGQVVVSKPQGQGTLVILPFLAEPVRQSSEAAAGHPRGGFYSWLVPDTGGLP